MVNKFDEIKKEVNELKEQLGYTTDDVHMKNTDYVKEDVSMNDESEKIDFEAETMKILKQNPW